MATQPQSFENHRKVVPLFLAAAFGLMLNLGWAVTAMVRRPDYEHAVGLLLAIALVLMLLQARGFALTVQNRVIRLEMRLRLKEILPADLQPRIAEFTLNQLIALRFAGDGELPDLARAVLCDKIEDKKTIKKMVKHWQADDLRA